VIVIGLLSAWFFVRYQALKIERGRKRDADAYSIGKALVSYMHKHNGAIPPSLSDLEFEHVDVDVSPFQLLQPGAKMSSENKRILVKAEEGNGSPLTIYIDEDGAVDWALQLK